MSQPTRVIKNDLDELPQDIKDLCEAVTALPTGNRGGVDRLVQQVIDGTNRRRRILGLVQEALSQLRLDMKYLMFDLEATRRERDELQRRLESREE
ncbi:MAG: transcriptional regulator [Pirellulales bacterium]|nr:transcriptional regulator [Planctomycetales bacterium]